MRILSLSLSLSVCPSASEFSELYNNIVLEKSSPLLYTRAQNFIRSVHFGALVEASFLVPLLPPLLLNSLSLLSFSHSLLFPMKSSCRTATVEVPTVFTE